jgi:hypothetical protein
MKTVSYTKMTDATPEDFELLRREGVAYFSAASERILAALETASGTSSATRSAS